MSEVHKDVLGDVLAATARSLDPLASDGEHLDPEVLVGYHEGTLSDDEAARAQDHLVACSVCSELIADLAAGFAPTTDLPDNAVDFEKEAEWRKLQARLDLSPAPSPEATVRHSDRVQGTRTPVLPWALAAVLLATVAGLAWQVMTLGREAAGLRMTIAELEAPQAGVGMVYLDAVTRNREPIPTVTVHPERPRFVVILTPPIDAGDGPFRVEVLDEGATPRWAADGLLVNDHATLRVGLSRRFLPPGAYRVRLKGEDGTLLDERLMRVVDG